jgi:hypothetical protein
MEPQRDGAMKALFVLPEAPRQDPVRLDGPAPRLTGHPETAVHHGYPMNDRLEGSI